MEKKVVVEVESLKDLERLISESEKWGLKLVLIGGYAVRAYTRGYRYTKDMDFIVGKMTGELKGLLKSLGYEIREKDFMLAGRKKLDGGFIDLHISVGDVFDESTGRKYPFTDQVLSGAKTMEVSGYHEEGRTIRVRAPVTPLEDLIILKLMTKGREKDTVDLISLFIDRHDDLSLEKMSVKCSEAELSRHIKDSVLDLMGTIRRGDARKIWIEWTGERLMRKTETGLIKHLREMVMIL